MLAGATDPIAFGAPITFTTTVPNEQIEIWLDVANASNASAAGGALYNFLLDGVSGSDNAATAGSGPNSASLNRQMTIAAPGIHTLGAQATAVTGNETINVLSLMVYAFGAV